MSTPVSILILGAGELGLAMLRAFAAKAPTSKYHLTVALRPSTASLPASDPKIFPIHSLPHIAILPCDLAASSRSELTAAFTPFNVVICCTGYDSNSSTGGVGLQTKITNAVLATGTVDLFVPWQFGVDYDTIGRGSAQDSFDEQLDVRDLLRNAKKNGVKTDWIIVSTGMFTSFLFEPWFGVVGKDQEGGWTVAPLGKWSDRVTVTGPGDIGRVTAEIIERAVKEGADGRGGVQGKVVRNQVLFVAGDTVTYEKLAQVVGEVTGKTVRMGEEVSLEQAGEELRKDPGNVVKKYRAVWVNGNGVSWPLEETYNARNDIPMEDVKTWASNSLIV